MRFIGLILLLAASVATSGAASVAHAACELTERTSVKLEVIGGRILVPVVVNGITGLFTLDTGAARSLVTRAAVQHLELARDAWVGTAMRGVGGVETLPNADPRSITLGGVKLMRRTITRDTSLTVGTMPSTMVGERTIDGLLGRDFLSVFDLALDLPAQTLTLYTVHECAGRFLPWTGPYSAIQLQNPMENALVVPVVLDGRSLRALLDTGAGSTLIAAPGMARLGLTEAHMATDPTQTVSGLGPRTVVMRRHRFTSLHVGTETIAQPVYWAAPIQLSPIVDMLLGYDWLAGKRVWISFATKQLFVAG